MSPHSPFDPFEPFDDGAPEDASHDAASPIAGPTDLALPHAAASDPRATLARTAVHDVEAFAASLGVRVTGVDAFLATLPAPGPDAPFVGVRGLRHHVEQHVLASVAEALTQNVSSIELSTARDDG